MPTSTRLTLALCLPITIPPSGPFLPPRASALLAMVSLRLWRRPTTVFTLPTTTPVLCRTKRPVETTPGSSTTVLWYGPFLLLPFDDLVLMIYRRTVRPSLVSPGKPATYICKYDAPRQVCFNVVYKKLIEWYVVLPRSKGFSDFTATIADILDDLTRSTQTTYTNEYWGSPVYLYPTKYISPQSNYILLHNNAQTFGKWNLR